jgi:hypothetical protein
LREFNVKQLDRPIHEKLDSETVPSTGLYIRRNLVCYVPERRFWTTSLWLTI